MNLKVFELHGNLLELQDKKDLIQILQEIPSIKLESLILPQTSFEQEALQCLKYLKPMDIVEMPLKYMKYNQMILDKIIICNTTWTELRKLNLSGRSIGDDCGVQFGSNTI